jgi:cysteine desulfurase
VTATRAYLDHNATTPLHPAARDAMCAAYEHCGNASSIHAEGRIARAMIEAARAEIAGCVGVPARDVVFTSGGTEALNSVLTPHLQAAGATSRPFDLLLAGAGEHAAVLAGHRFPAEAVALVGLTAQGQVDLAALDEALARHSGRRIMLALQLANNETGVIQPVAEAAERIHAVGGILVCDGVQGAGKIACDIHALGADALVLSAHKFGGPQGVGAVCFGAGLPHITNVLLRGGGQERGLRAGTENIAGIVGMAAALRAAVARVASDAGELAGWRDRLEDLIAAIEPGTVVFGANAPRLPNTSFFAVPEVEAQVLLMFLDVEGVSVSTGSACSSGKVKRSHVLAAMGVRDELARGAIRLSLGWTSRPEDCETFGRAFEKALRTIGARRGRSNGAVEVIKEHGRVLA